MKFFLSSLLAITLAVSLVGVASAAAEPKCETGKVCLENPLQPKVAGDDTTDATYIIGIVITAALSVIGALTLLMFVYGAGAWLTSAGNPEKVTAGAKTMLWAAIGTFAVFASYVVLKTALGFVTGTISAP